MIQTKILTDQEPLENILNGAEKLYKAVSVTMGPRGSNVIIRKAGGRTFVTHDGVTVAKSVKLNNDAEDVAAELLREAAVKLDSTTGDGTTTVTVLAYALLKGAAELVKNGHNAMQVNLALKSFETEIVDAIKAASKDVAFVQDLVDVATVSSGDKTIGAEVGKVVYDAGKDTPVVLGFSNSTDTTVEVIRGVRIDSGAASPYLLDEGVKTIIESPHVIVCDAKLREKGDVLPILEAISRLDSHDFVLVTSDIAGDALGIMIMNKMRNFGNIAIARVPASITSQTEYLADIALATGATVLVRNGAHSIATPTPDDFGSAESVIVRPLETIIVNGGSSEEDLNARVAMLTEVAKTATEKATKTFIKQRLKFLSQKLVSIHVGGQSETEAEERHYRYEDAIGACQAALRHGIVPGGGTVLYAIGSGLNGVLHDALQAPLKHVLSNAGIAVPDGIHAGWGIDVMNPENGCVDLVHEGIVDPTESEIECVKTAITIAGLLLTSGALIVDEVTETPRYDISTQ